MKTLLTLTKRNMKCFLRDRMGVFFSLLAPLLVLLLFVLFLGDVQVDSASSIVKQYAGEGVVEESLLKALVNSWMVAGVLGVGCLTVALSAVCVVVRDKETMVSSDFIASPVKKSIVYLAYFLGVFVVTTIIMLIVALVGIIYLLAVGSLYASFVDVLALFGIVILGSASATLFIMLITCFIKSEGTHGAFTGIVCAVSGFLIGAYMPVSIYPKGIQYVSNVLPGSHVAGLLRRNLLGEVMQEVASKSSPQAEAILKDYFSTELNFFGKMIDGGPMLIFVIASTAVLLVANIFITRKFLIIKK